MIQPLRDLVLIKADQPKTETASGILLAEEEWKTLPPTGEVMAIGPEVKAVSIGDRVMFERYGSIVLEGDNRICKEELVQGVLNG